MPPQDTTLQNIANKPMSDDQSNLNPVQAQEDTNVDASQSNSQPASISIGGPEGGAKIEDDVKTIMEQKLDRLDEVMDDYGLVSQGEEQKALEQLINAKNPDEEDILLKEIRK